MIDILEQHRKSSLMALYTTSRQGNGDSDNGCGDSKLRLVTITLIGHTRVFDLGKDLMFLCLSNYSHLNLYDMVQSKYEPLVKELVSKGMNFRRDVWQLRSDELAEFGELAKKYGYKKPLQHSRGFGFYLLLQKVYNKMEDKS